MGISGIEVPSFEPPGVDVFLPAPWLMPVKWDPEANAEARIEWRLIGEIQGTTFRGSGEEVGRL